jgi:hypothetical protein
MRNPIMRNPILFAIAATLLTVTAAFAQSTTPNSSADRGMTMQGQTPKSTSGDTMKGADASAEPTRKSHRRMARNEARQNAKEAEVTKQLNQEQATMARSDADATAGTAKSDTDTP